MSVSLKEAQAVIELARVHAEKIGVPMNIAVVDGGGHLLAFARMDRSILGSIDIALKKAKPRSSSMAPARACGSTASRAAPRPPPRARTEG